MGTQTIQVGKSKKKPLIGIVGGIASGKSTVAAEFERLGCALIDADALARSALGEPAVREALVRRFGPSILNAAGQIDRRGLAQCAFADAEAVAALNAIVHPPVMRRVEELIAHYEHSESVPAIVLDVPLLVEVGWAERCDRLVFVDSRWERRVERARRKNGLNETDIKIRENFQISLDTKADLADNTIDNNSGFSALVRQIQDIFSDMTKK
ncbi:MAG: dephospho-CoA kinase [Sedimentisphaerales bacterium]|nr:dephospho-CoA kinase [Sedimentisphaerales bacterium]